MTDARRDLLVGCLTAAVALLVYLRTLAPGLAAVGDAPVFQFVGRVLGTPHNPGYPLFVLLTHPLAYLPFGSFAYRVNLFSACAGALAVGLVFACARALGCSRASSAAAALAFGFGHTFWSQAVVAEVYTLNAALVAGMLAGFAWWGRTGKAAAFYTGTFCLALGLAHHTTIALFAPGVLVYALRVKPAFVFRPRTIAACAAIALIGLSPYALILIRSHQSGVYLESRATTLAELVDVVRGKQFAHQLFAFDAPDVLAKRLPMVFERLVLPELTYVGAAASLAGLVWLLRKRLSEGLLLSIGAAATLLFAANYDVLDLEVFVIPAVLVAWLFGAVGADQLNRLAARIPGGAVAAAAIAGALPIWLFATNLERTDRSRDVEAEAHMDRLFERLPERTAFVSEDFLVDRMVSYQLLGADRGRGRRIIGITREPDMVESALAEGFNVFAFAGGARQLRQAGFDVAYDQTRLRGAPLGVLLAGLRPGCVVAIAVPAGHAHGFDGAVDGLDVIRAPARPGALDRPSAQAIVGSVGGLRSAAHRAAPDEVDLRVPVTHLIDDAGTGFPGDIRAVANRDEAAVMVGTREVVRTTAGVAVAVWNENGALRVAFVLEPESGYRVPANVRRFDVRPVLPASRRQHLQPGHWADISSVARTGSVVVRVPPGASVTLRVGSDGRLRPRVFDRPTAAVQADLPWSSSSAAGQPMIRGGPVLPDPATAHRYQLEVSMRGSAREPGAAQLAFGGIPSYAVALLTPSARREPVTADVIAVDTGGLPETQDARTDIIRMGRTDQAQLLGEGWSDAEGDAIGPYRWFTSAASLLLPSRDGGGVALRLHARAEPADRAGAVRLGGGVNGRELPPMELSPGWRTYEWPLPPGLLHTGSNELTLSLKGGNDRIRLGVATVAVVYSESRPLDR